MAAVHVRDAPPDHLLGIYLTDHLSGASAGRALARRAWHNNRGTPYEAGLQRLVQEIEGEMVDLRAIISHHGHGSSVVPMVKVTAALVGERLGRFKLNGQLQGYSPLSRIVEIEGLAIGVQGKRMLWKSLERLQSPDALPHDVELAPLVEQAEGQLALLRDLHERAAEAAFRAP